MTMMKQLFRFLLLSAVGLGLVKCQEDGDIIYHSTPKEVWRKTFNAIGQGNGVYLAAPDLLVAVSRAGIVRGFNPSDGTILWTFSPLALTGGSVSCQGGMTLMEPPSSTALLAT